MKRAVCVTLSSPPNTQRPLLVAVFIGALGLGTYFGLRSLGAVGEAAKPTEVQRLSASNKTFFPTPDSSPGSAERHRVDAALRSLVARYRAALSKGEQPRLDELAPQLPVEKTRLSLELLFKSEAETSQFVQTPLAQRNRVYARGRFSTGHFHINDFEKLTSQQGLRWIRPAYAASSVGAVTSQGDVALAADLGRATAPGFSGEGLTIGALSDSFDISTRASTNAADDIANGDLPAQLAFVADYDGQATDEGRAMLQIIADLAPGAGLAFHTAKGGQVAFADAIERLRAEGADILVDDIIYLAEPMFQDGVIAQAVEAVTADGALYFSAAGNNGDTSWESSYLPSTQWIGLSNGPLIDFDTGPDEDVFLAIDLPVGRQISVVLQWSEPFASVPGSVGSASDFDFYMTGTDDSLTQVLNGSVAPNVGLDPVEVFSFENDGDIDLDGTPGPDTRFHLVIEHVSGPPPALLKIVAFASGRSVFVDDGISASTLYGHANAASAFAVGAAAFSQTPAFGSDPARVQNYSALGGVPIYYDSTGGALPQPVVRAKPDFVAADGVNTTFFGTNTSIDSDSLPNFFGTSAAAPHAAAIAALFLEKAGGPGSLDRVAVSALFEAGALDMGPAGFDEKTGAGLIQADVSIAATPLGFPAWRRLQLPDLATLTLETDSDADRLPDVLEYYLGTLPLIPNPPPFIQSIDGDTMVLEISSAAYLAQPISLLEISPNLIQWDPLDYSLLTPGEHGADDLIRYEIPPREDGNDNFIRITPVAPAGL